MTDPAKISNLQPGEVTIELLRLIDEARAVERRMLLHNFTGNDTETDATKLRKHLGELLEAMPDEERRIQLYPARRLIHGGQRVHGPYDLHLPRKDGRAPGVNTLEEMADAVNYELEDTYRGQGGELLPDVNGLMRRRVVLLLKREAI